MMEDTLKAIFDRLSEGSTWAGIGVAAVAVNEGALSAMTADGGGLGALLAFATAFVAAFLKDKGGKV